MRTLITSTEIGEITLNQLKKIDAIAYVRFASVYRKFKDVEEFIEAIRTLEDGK